MLSHSHTIRFSSLLSLVLLSAPALALAMPCAPAQTTYSGVEPNQNKFEATPAPDMVAGDMLEVFDCGFTASHNVFRVGTAPAPLAIYQHRFTGIPSDDIEIQGRGAIEDLAFPQSVEILSSSKDIDPFLTLPYVAWYGFGKSEELYVDFNTIAGCRAGNPGTSVLSTTTVTPTVLAPFQAVTTGSRQLFIDVLGVGQERDTEFQLFDSEFNPIYAAGRDQPTSFSSTASLAVNVADGRYYLAVSDHELATHLPPTALTPEFRVPSEITDFRGTVVNGSSNFPIDLLLRVSDFVNNQTQELQVTKTSSFEVLWFQFDVGTAQASSTFCTGDGSTGPCPACSSDAPLGSGTGCRNSTGRGAALTYFRLPGFGSPLPNLLLEGVPSQAAALIFVSAGAVASVEIGGGLFCLQGGAYRQQVLTSRIDGMATLPLNDSAFPASMFGQTVFAQALYRDSDSPCGLNVSSGMSFILR